MPVIILAWEGHFPMQWDVYSYKLLERNSTVFTNPSNAFVAVYPMETEAMLYKDTRMDTFIARGGEEEQKIT